MSIKILATKIKPEAKVEIPTYQDVCEKFDNKEITGFQTEREKFRLFRAQGGMLCYFRKGSSRRGYILNETHLVGFRKWLTENQVSLDDQQWKIIDKYRSYAEKATFTNRFIVGCLNLPKTQAEWIAAGKKSLYDYGVTTGVQKEGEVITVDALKKAFRLDPIKHAIQTQTNYESSRNDFRGYDASVSFRKDENGDFKGYLSLEYRGTGNGHYYLLINNECFIYYDKD